MRKALVLMLSTCVCLIARADDHHPLFAAYPGASLKHQLTFDYENFALPKSLPDANGKFEALPLTGDLYQHFYEVENASTLKVYENYLAAVKKLGFDIVFTCKHEACGDEDASDVIGNRLSPNGDVYNFYRKPYYLLAQKETPRGRVTGAWYIGAYEDRTGVQQVIVEGEPLDNGLIHIDTAYLSRKPQATSPVETADAEELSKDHALFARYPGASVRRFEKVDHETFTVPAAPGAPDQTPLNLSGDLSRHFYRIKDTSTLKVYENYKRALDTAGFSVLSRCELEACGKDREAQKFGGKISIEDDVYNFYRKPYYIVAKRAFDEREVYVALFIGAYEAETAVQQVIIETEALDTDLIKVDADALKRQIEATGKALIYGIYFDTGKAVVKPESRDALEAIAALLNRDMALSLYVVGHTDDTGSRDSNVTLSKQRAAAVVNALVTNHGITSSRLLAQGVGPFAPASSNGNDLGREKNRRVELVKQLQ